MSLEDVVSAARHVAEQREALARALQERDVAIRHAFNERWPIGAIAEAANLTPARVANVLGHPFQHVGRPPKPSEH